jgi:hypothetical protein
VPATLDHAGCALAAARAAGLEARSAEVVTVSANVLVRVEPGPVAARLAGAIGGIRDAAVNLAREARVAAALARRGAPVPAPLSGPIDTGRRTVTLWPWLDQAAGSGDSAAAGAALRACHDALEGVDGAALGLRPLAMLHEARALADGYRGPERTLIADAVERALAALGGLPVRPVHGDSHPGNVLWTAEGPLWGDWEDAHLAPLEWDLACLVAPGRLRGDDFGWGEAALAAHGGAYDPRRLDACVHARAAQGAAYMAHLLPADADLRSALAFRVEWLRAGG